MDFIDFSIFYMRVFLKVVVDRSLLIHPKVYWTHHKNGVGNLFSQYFDCLDQTCGSRKLG